MTPTVPRPLTLVLPYYNEAGFIEATLASLAGQTVRDFTLVLVDNGSTDGSGAICRGLTAGWDDIAVIHCDEPRPGKLYALQAGIARVASPLMATLDADTIYPPGYVARIIALFAAHPAAAMVMAADVYGDPAAPAARRRRRAIALLARIFPGKCHTGAFGQAFRTAAYRAAGGYDPAIWPFVLEDHELIHRVGRHGRQVYAADHWCQPSARRADRTAVSWTGAESLLYVLVPGRWMDWFFYRFLARRFAARGLANANLRARTWAAPPAVQAAGRRSA